jgi:FkbM family methyltransferase
VVVVAFEKIARFLPESSGRYLSPARYGLLHSKRYARELIGSQRLVAVDVGAANGLLPHWYSLDGIAQVYQIDPRVEACQELEAINRGGGHPDLYKVVCAAVAGTEGPRTLYVSNAPTGSSLFPPDFSSAADAGAYLSEDYFFPMVERVIETRTLQSIFDELSEPTVDLIKLDIQGAELEALSGLGKARLKDLIGVELEVGMTGLYQEAADFSAVQKFMTSQGFELYDVRVARSRLPYRGKHGAFQAEIFSTYENSPTISARVWEFDVVYFKKRSLLLEEGDGDKLRRMAICYLVYNYFAEAHSLIESAEKVGIFSQSESMFLKSLIVTIHRVREFRPWFANNRFWNWARRLGERLAPRSTPRWCQYMYQDYPSG